MATVARDQITDLGTRSIPATPGTEVIHANRDLYPNSLASVLILGASGTGKSRLLLSLIPWLTSRIRTLLIATTVRGNPVHRDILDWAKKRGMTRGVFETPEALRGALEDLVSSGELSMRGKHALLVADDFTSSASPQKFAACLEHLCSTYRNSGCHFIVLTQSPKNVSTQLRNNLSTVISFALGNKWARLVADGDVVLPAHPEFEDLREALDEWLEEIRYSWAWYTKRPVAFGCGLGSRMAVLADRQSVLVPNPRETMAALHVANVRDMRTRAAQLQRAAGNDSPKVVERSEEGEGRQD